MRMFIALIVIVYLIGVGVPSLPRSEKSNTATAAELTLSVGRLCPTPSLGQSPPVVYGKGTGEAADDRIDLRRFLSNVELDRARRARPIPSSTRDTDVEHLARSH